MATPKCQHSECALWYPDREECDDCIDGRWLGAICDYASTCDGCGELTHHDYMHMDPETQLGYCDECWAEMHKESAEEPDI